MTEQEFLSAITTRSVIKHLPSGKLNIVEYIDTTVYPRQLVFQDKATLRITDDLGNYEFTVQLPAEEYLVNNHWTLEVAKVEGPTTLFLKSFNAGYLWIVRDLKIIGTTKVRLIGQLTYRETVLQTITIPLDQKLEFMLFSKYIYAEHIMVRNT
jgi:hypothetical protein